MSNLLQFDERLNFLKKIIKKKMEEIIANKYRLIKKIGQGSFGRIYIAEDIRNGARYAVKLEFANTKIPQILFEARLYQIMSGSVNVPRIYYHNTDHRYNTIVIDLLSKSLEDLLTQCKRKMSLKTVLMLCDQMITAVEFFHTKNYIHRDIKPDNFVMGTGKNANKCYIIDYGLAKKYRDQTTHQHIPYIEGKSLTGTARYASVNALLGCEQSRRDDMEALAYVWIYLLKGNLPWMGVDGRTREEKYRNIALSKKNTPIETLCSGLPSEFAVYLRAVRKLGFTEKPSYEMYRQLFRKLFMRNNYVYDYSYDWTSPFDKATVITNRWTEPRQNTQQKTGGLAAALQNPGRYYNQMEQIRPPHHHRHHTQEGEKKDDKADEAPPPVKYVTKKKKDRRVIVSIDEGSQDKELVTNDAVASCEYRQKSEALMHTIDFEVEEKEMPSKPLPRDQIEWGPDDPIDSSTSDNYVRNALPPAPKLVNVPEVIEASDNLPSGDEKKKKRRIKKKKTKGTGTDTDPTPSGEQPKEKRRVKKKKDTKEQEQKKTIPQIPPKPAQDVRRYDRPDPIDTKKDAPKNQSRLLQAIGLGEQPYQQHQPPIRQTVGYNAAVNQGLWGKNAANQAPPLKKADLEVSPKQQNYYNAGRQSPHSPGANVGANAYGQQKYGYVSILQQRNQQQQQQQQQQPHYTSRILMQQQNLQTQKEQFYYTMKTVPRPEEKKYGYNQPQNHYKPNASPREEQKYYSRDNADLRRTTQQNTAQAYQGNYYSHDKQRPQNTQKLNTTTTAKDLLRKRTSNEAFNQNVKAAYPSQDRRVHGAMPRIDDSDDIIDSSESSSGYDQKYYRRTQPQKTQNRRAERTLDDIPAQKTIKSKKKPAVIPSSDSDSEPLTSVDEFLIRRGVIPARPKKR